MTSTTGAAGHPDVDEISALVEDLLSVSLASDIRRHLSTCRDCSDTYEALQEIRELLGASPEPLPMPADVVKRIDAALAAEAATPSPEAGSSSSLTIAAFVDSLEPTELSTAESTDLPPADASDTTDHPSGQRATAHVSRETSLMEPSGTPADRPSGRPRGSTGPGRTSRGRLGRRRTITLGAVFTAVAIGLGSLLLQSMTNDSSGPDAGNSSPPSGTRPAFSSRTLEGQVTSLLEEHPAPPKTQPPSATVIPTPPVETGSPQVTPSPTPSVTKSGQTMNQPDIGGVIIPECVRNGIGRSDAPIAMEQGTFEGTDAYLVVLPDPADGSKVSAYVVDASCVKRPAIPLGTVLLTGSFPRR